MHEVNCQYMISLIMKFMKLSFIHVIKVRVDNDIAKVSQRLSMILNMTVGQESPRCMPTIVVSSNSKPFGCVLHLVNHVVCYV